jgi:hypothetical protein
MSLAAAIERTKRVFLNLFLVKTNQKQSNPPDFSRKVRVFFSKNGLTLRENTLLSCNIGPFSRSSSPKTRRKVEATDKQIYRPAFGHHSIQKGS